MANPSDRDLVERARKGEAEAFGTLVHRYQKRIFRLALHFTRNAVEAEDVTQETFVRAYQALSGFDNRSEPFSWLYRIAVNLSINYLRKTKRRGPVTSSDDPRISMFLKDLQLDPPTPADQMHQKRLGVAILDGIDALSETLRTTLLLVSVDGLTADEAGEILGCSRGTISWRVHEARRRLKLYLDEQGFGGDLE